MCEQSKARNSFTSSHGKPSPGKLGSITLWKSKDNLTCTNFIPFFLLPPALDAEYDAVGSEMSLWSVGVSCPSLWHHRYNGG